MWFDVNCYLGAWPFSLFPERSAAELAAHLARSGIRRAALSPFGAVFQPEPMPANRQLFAAVRRVKAFVPLPVINPLLANWCEQLQECCDSTEVRTVRLIPNYHNYRLRAPQLTAFMAKLAEMKVRIVLTARIEDERARYFALSIKGVPVSDMAHFLRRFPAQPPLITGLSVGELLKLAGERANFYADLAYTENMALAEMLRGKIPFSRLMFGTLSPLLSAQAQTAKLSASTFSAVERREIGFSNALNFFHEPRPRTQSPG